MTRAWQYLRDAMLALCLSGWVSCSSAPVQSEGLELSATSSKKRLPTEQAEKQI
jgi:hypothetical protein